MPELDCPEVPFLEGTFLRRPNRFVVYAAHRDQEYCLHIPNPGSLGELLLPGRKLLFEKKNTPRTQGLVRGVFYKRQWVPLVAVKANELAEVVLEREGHDGPILREHTHRHSRFDLHLPLQNRTIEVKSCTLVEHGRAMFPDAPSHRALRHLEELVSLKEEGIIDAGEIWVMVLHSQPESFTPSYHTDPALSQALLKNSQCGETPLRAFLFSCDRALKPRFLRELPVDFGPVKHLQTGGICLAFEKEGKKLAVQPMGPWTGKSREVHRRYQFPELHSPFKTFPIYTSDPGAYEWWQRWADENAGKKALFTNPAFWDALLHWRHRGSGV